ncbi:MAG: methionyl-tRNA formyltransferase [Chloroflexi bacterium]|nr:methionyl-tRNA formyltransferase [Chloroflexota bacterium]
MGMAGSYRNDRARSPLRLVFMGTPAFAVPALERLAADGHELVAVYTQPDKPAGRGRAVAASPVKERALTLGLAVRQPPTLRRPQEVESLQALAPQAIVVAAYGKLLPPEVLAVPPLGCLNIHPSLLPRHRGPAPVAAALLAGDPTTGVTIMLLDAGMDTGPILMQREVAIGPEETAGALAGRLARLGADLLAEALVRWAAGQLRPQPQDASLATVSRRLAKEEGELDWARPAPELARQVRALQPWPGTYTRWQGRVLKVLEARAWPELASPGPGVVWERNAACLVGTGDGCLELHTIQLEGRRPVSAAEFLRGQPSFREARLGS